MQVAEHVPELVPLDLDTMTTALMKSMRLPQAALEDEDTRLGASYSAKLILKQLPPLYLVRLR